MPQPQRRFFFRKALTVSEYADTSSLSFFLRGLSISNFLTKRETIPELMSCVIERYVIKNIISNVRTSDTVNAMLTQSGKKKLDNTKNSVMIVTRKNEN